MTDGQEPEIETQLRWIGSPSDLPPINRISTFFWEGERKVLKEKPCWRLRVISSVLLNCTLPVMCCEASLATSTFLAQNESIKASRPHYCF